MKPGARASRAYTMHHRRLEVDRLRPRIPGSEALPGSPSTARFIDAPTVAFTAIDADAAAERVAKYDQMYLTAGSSLPVGVAEYDRTLNLIHPTKDEQLALIRQSCEPKGEEA